MVFNTNEVKTKVTKKAIIAFSQSFPLKKANITPGTNPNKLVPIPIIGLYTPIGAIMPAIKSPIKPTAKPSTGPNNTPAIKQTVATSDSCVSGVGICKMFTATDNADNIDIYAIF